jgi:nucleotidyltransferase substrate binding protein (TIGR01987 family)
MITSQNHERCRQRLQNYSLALSQLKQAVDLGTKNQYSNLEMHGLIQTFEFTHELACKLLKAYLDSQGNGENINGSKDATKRAFQLGLVDEGDIWMQMIESRNLALHTYNLKVAKEIASKICANYFPQFLQLQEKMQGTIGKTF